MARLGLCPLLALRARVVSSMAWHSTEPTALAAGLWMPPIEGPETIDWVNPHLSVISEMPRATLCGPSRSFAVGEVVPPKLLPPIRSGGKACKSLLTKKLAFLPHKVAGDVQKLG
jgi:hypothetical protein